MWPKGLSPLTLLTLCIYAHTAYSYFHLSKNPALHKQRYVAQKGALPKYPEVPVRSPYAPYRPPLYRPSGMYGQRGYAYHQNLAYNRALLAQYQQKHKPMNFENQRLPSIDYGRYEVRRPSYARPPYGRLPQPPPRYYYRRPPPRRPVHKCKPEYSLNCERFCPKGNILDDKGCKTCECCPVPNCLGKCRHGSEIIRGCETCNCRSAPGLGPQIRKCPRKWCKISCKWGKQRDRHGCELCRCLRRPPKSKWRSVLHNRRYWGGKSPFGK